MNISCATTQYADASHYKTDKA